MQPRNNVCLALILLLWSLSFITIIVPGIPVAQQPQITDFDLKPVSEIAKPAVGKLSGQPKGTSPQAAPIFKHAVIDVEILNYDRNSPPELRIFDNDGTNNPIHIVKFAPHPKRQPPEKSLSVPIFLVYDSTPWKNSDHRPKERTTRIELHMPVLDDSKPLETVYAKLAKDIYVVPVVWHNVTDSTENWKSYVNNQHVIDLFCRAPTQQEMKYPDVASSVNALWVQAGVQFRLVGMDVPWRVNSIPTHSLQPTESSTVKAVGTFGTCGWKLKTLSSPDGVDIFAVYNLTNTSEMGLGNNWVQGRVYIKANNPAASSPGFTDPQWNAQARAQLVAHEFGHYLGSLPHDDWRTHTSLPWGNLMNMGANGSKLECFQIKRVRDQIHQKMQVGANPYNEKF